MFRPAAFLVAVLVPSLAVAQDWPQWRGPNFDGSSAVSGLPKELSEKDVHWAAELPGPSAATPIIVGKNVFVTAAVEEAGLLLALCLDRATGEVLWEDEAGSGYQPGGKGSKTSIDKRSDYA